MCVWRGSLVITTCTVIRKWQLQSNVSEERHPLLSHTLRHTTDLFTQACAVDGRAVTVTRTVRVRTSAERESERWERAGVSKIRATVRTEQDEGGKPTPGLLCTSYLSVHPGP